MGCLTVNAAAATLDQTQAGQARHGLAPASAPAVAEIGDGTGVAVAVGATATTTGRRVGAG